MARVRRAVRRSDGSRAARVRLRPLRLELLTPFTRPPATWSEPTVRRGGQVMSVAHGRPRPRSRPQRQRRFATLSSQRTMTAPTKAITNAPNQVVTASVCRIWPARNPPTRPPRMPIRMFGRQPLADLSPLTTTPDSAPAKKPTMIHAMMSSWNAGNVATSAGLLCEPSYRLIGRALLLYDGPNPRCRAAFDPKPDPAYEDRVEE